MEKPMEEHEQKPDREGRDEISIQADYKSEPPMFYSNWASITHTGEDLCLDFCIIAPPHNIDTQAKTLSARTVARVIIPPKMAKGLMEALDRQLRKQENEESKLVIALARKEEDSNE